ncbi:acylphosphatase-1-like [Lissotriton helveticus]
MADGDGMLSVDYEAFGRVQGVFFRKYVQALGRKPGLVGWVQNINQHSVRGQLQALISHIRDIQTWLQKKGSPNSRICRAEFRNERQNTKLEHSDFSIVK